MFTEESSTGYPKFVAFCVATIHSPFCFAHTASYKQLDRTQEIYIFSYYFFRRLFLDYLLVENMPISILNWERTTLRGLVEIWLTQDRSDFEIWPVWIFRIGKIKLNKIEKMSETVLRRKKWKSPRLGSILNILHFWQQGT